MASYDSREISERADQVLTLSEGLQSILQPLKIQLWPQRLVSHAQEELEPKTHIYYYLIGLPNLASPQLKSSKQMLREWQNRTSQKSIKAKFIPRRILLEYSFKDDVPIASTSLPPEKSMAPQASSNFKKTKGSNPKEIRQQFLQHVLRQESETEENNASSGSGKLRPIKEVLNRLRYDVAYNVEDYVVGYIDRKAGILEMPALEWGALVEEELVAYLKYIPDDMIVWNRARKVDLVSRK